MDIVRVWTVQHCESGDHLNILFPLLNAKICAFFKQENCGVGYLAGAVAAETFLLNLTLKVQVDSLPRPDLQKELTIWSGNSISAFQNYVFFDIILRLLLKPPMPVITILGRYPPVGYHPSDTTCWMPPAGFFPPSGYPRVGYPTSRYPPAGYLFFRYLPAGHPPSGHPLFGYPGPSGSHHGGYQENGMYSHGIGQGKFKHVKHYGKFKHGKFMGKQ